MKKIFFSIIFSGILILGIVYGINEKRSNLSMKMDFDENNVVNAQLLDAVTTSVNEYYKGKGSEVGQVTINHKTIKNLSSHPQSTDNFVVELEVESRNKDAKILGKDQVAYLIKPDQLGNSLKKDNINGIKALYFKHNS